MRLRRPWNALGAVLLAFGAGCGAFETDSSAQLYPSELGPEPYMLGGQTGSLVPDCGVAPLSSSGVAVPSGDAVAVLYGSGCPEAIAAARVGLTGPDERPLSLTLERLDGGAYLVRASGSLDGGQYALGVEGQPERSLAIDDETSALPARLGELSVAPGGDDCGGLEFDLELTAEAAAHVPLMRWFVRIDGGREQVWIEYGALEVVETQGGRRGVLRLPRCGRIGGCLTEGTHELELRVEIAGAPTAPAPMTLDFHIECPTPNTAQVAAEPASDDGCVIRSAQPAKPDTCLSILGVAAVAVAARLRRPRLREFR
jgi:hypothetical protein